MKILEKILWLLFVVGCTLRFFQIPGGSMLLMLTSLLLAVVYMLLGFALINGVKLKTVFKAGGFKGITTMQILIAVFAGISFGFLVLGASYRLLMYSGAMELLMSGFLFAFPAMIMAMVSRFKNKYPQYREFILRFSFIACLGLASMLMSDSTIVSFNYSYSHPIYVELYKAREKYPDNVELKKVFDLREAKFRFDNFKEYDRFLDANYNITHVEADSIILNWKRDLNLD